MIANLRSTASALAAPEKMPQREVEEPDQLITKMSHQDFGEMISGGRITSTSPWRKPTDRLHPSAVLDREDADADPNEPSEAVDSLGFVRADAIVSIPQPWLWERRIPLGKLTLLEGHAGRGKTFVAIDLVAGLTNGRGFPDGSASPAGPPPRVLYLDYENGMEMVAARLTAAGADLKRVVILDHASDAVGLGPLKDPANVMKLEQRITRLWPDTSLIVLDGIVSAVGVGDTNDEAKVRAALQPLCAMAKRRNIAILGIKHFRKDTKGLSRAAGGGSGAWGAVARCVIQVWELDDVRYLAWEKLSDARSKGLTLTFAIPDAPDGQWPKLQWTGPSDLTAQQLAAREAAAEAIVFEQQEPHEYQAVFDLLQPGERATPEEMVRRAKAQGISGALTAAALQAAKRKAHPDIRWTKLGAHDAPFGFVRTGSPVPESAIEAEVAA